MAHVKSQTRPRIVRLSTMYWENDHNDKGIRKGSMREKWKVMRGMEREREKEGGWREGGTHSEPDVNGEGEREKEDDYNEDDQWSILAPFYTQSPSLSRGELIDTLRPNGWKNDGGIVRDTIITVEWKGRKEE